MGIHEIGKLIMVTVSFWCKQCKKDLDLPARKVRDGEEVFVTNCPWCRKEFVRFITHPHKDEYYVSSRRVTIHRQQYAKDLVQPTQNDFQKFYRKEWLELEKKREEYEKEERKKRRERDAYYKKLVGYGGENRAAANKVMQIEEKIR